MLKYICYGNAGAQRPILIIDGQAYFQSAGESDPRRKGMWFPFIMAKGNIRPSNNNILTPPDHLNFIVINKLLFHPGYGNVLIASDKNTYNQSFDELVNALNIPLGGILQGKIITKRDLIVFLRLSRDVLTPEQIEQLMLAGNLNQAQRELAALPVVLEAKPEFVVNDPNVINLWLLVNGARDLQSLVSANVGLIDVVAKFSIHRLDELRQSFVKTYTTNLFQPAADQVLGEASLALKNLAEITHSFAKLKIQEKEPIQDVLGAVQEVCVHTEEFVKTQIGPKLDKRKKDQLVSFCEDKAERIRNKSRRLASPRSTPNAKRR